MDLTDYRKQIDAIDDQLVELIQQRMDVAAGIARYKKANGLKVLDASRERAKLQQVTELAGEEMQDYTASLYSVLFELSRSYQGRLTREETPLTVAIANARPISPSLMLERNTLSGCILASLSKTSGCSTMFQ